MNKELVKKGSSVLALLAILTAPSIAGATDNPIWTAPVKGLETLKLEHEEMTGSVMLYGRFTAIDGDVEPAVPVDYSDIFGTGTGFMIEGSLLWESGDWLLGGYISLGSDSFGGKKDTDAVGDSLEADDMDITTILFGFKGLYSLGEGFYVDAHGGIGIANYSSVDGTLTIGGTPFAIEVFGSTSAFAFDFGTRIGYSTGHFVADLGFGFRFQGAPDGGDLSLDTDIPAMAAFEIGAGVRF